MSHLPPSVRSLDGHWLVRVKAGTSGTLVEAVRSQALRAQSLSGDDEISLDGDGLVAVTVERETVAIAVPVEVLQSMLAQWQAFSRVLQ